MSTDVVVSGKYDLDHLESQAAEWREELGDDFVPEFPRIKVPGGGATVWEDSEGNPLKTLEGVLVAHRKSTRLYLEAFDDNVDGSGRPDAWSLDGKVQIVPQETVEKAQRLGLPVPLTNLKACPYYQWGSAHLVGGSGKGKATREYRDLYMLLDGQGILPHHIQIPTTSLKAFDNYAQNVVFRKGSLTAVETILGLERQDGGGSIKYSTVTFNRGNDLDPQLAANAKRYGRQIKNLLAQTSFDVVDGADATVTVETSAGESFVVDQTTGEATPAGDAGVAAVAEAFEATPVDTDDIDF